MTLHLAQNPEADALLTTDPLALLIGMVLDQQIPLERAFSAPAELQDRLGGRLDAEAIAAMDPSELASYFTAKPALHRFPGSMAGRVQELCRIVVDEYAGDPGKVWRDAKTGKDLLARLRRLPGFGDQKARIFMALLGKQLDVRPTGWRQASAPFGQAGTYRSVADIVDSASLARVRKFKQSMKAAAKVPS
jgi:uncharacterized HhH-GPD family protein